MIQRSIKATSYQATPSNYRDCNRVPLEIQPVFAPLLLADELEDKGKVESSLQGRKCGRRSSIFNGPSEKTPPPQRIGTANHRETIDRHGSRLAI